MNEDFEKPFTSPPTIFLIAVFVGVGLGMFAPLPLLPWPVRLTLGPVLALSGAFLIRRSIQEIEAASTTYDPYEVSTKLVTSGIYSHSRNPGYLGLALIQVGLAILLDNVWIIATGLAAVILTTHFVIRLEEQKLKDAFGESYSKYLRRVRRWL